MHKLVLFFKILELFTFNIIFIKFDQLSFFWMQNLETNFKQHYVMFYGKLISIIGEYLNLKSNIFFTSQCFRNHNNKNNNKTLRFF